MDHQGNPSCRRWNENLNKKFGSRELWPIIGCGARFFPWKRGPSMVAELRLDDGTWASFLCERPPAKLLDAIFHKMLAFYEAAGRLSAKEILEIVPITFPRDNILDQDLYPVVGRFNVDAAIRDCQPYFSIVSWVTLCRKIAANDMENLASIFEVCTALAGNDK